jgi:hypothetical protein
MPPQQQQYQGPGVGQYPMQQVEKSFICKKGRGAPKGILSTCTCVEYGVVIKKNCQKKTTM